MDRNVKNYVLKTIFPVVKHACQVSALHGLSCQNDLGKPTTYEKHAHKQVQLFIHQTTCASK